MGKGDKKTKRGKIIMGSYGIPRPGKTKKPVIKLKAEKAIAATEEKVEKKKTKKAEVEATEKKAPKKLTAKKTKKEETAASDVPEVKETEE